MGNIDKVHILEYSENRLTTILDTWNAIKPFAIVLYAYGKSDVWLDNIAEEIEAQHPEIAVLWVHPNEPRIIRGHKTPNPGMPILIMQSKSDLMAEKERLRRLGYYQAWK